MLPLCTSLEWATSAASIWRAEGGAQWTVLSDVSALEPLAWPPASPLIVRQAGKGDASVRVHIGTLHGESAAVLADVAFSSTGPTEIGDAPRLPAVDDEAVASAQRIYADVTRPCAFGRLFAHPRRPPRRYGIARLRPAPWLWARAKHGKCRRSTAGL